MTNARRMHPDQRREQLLAIGIALAEKHGYQWVTRTMIAEQANVVPSLTNLYWKTAVQMKRDILRQGIARGSLPILAQGLSDNQTVAHKAPQGLKQAALAKMMAA